MKKICFLFSIVFFASNFVFSQIKLADIVGVYQNCLIGCETYKLNADFTFDFLSSGDLDGGRTKGTWEFIGANKILIKFPKDEIESIQSDSSDSTVILDSNVTIQRPFPTNINFTKVIKDKQLCNLDDDGQITYCSKKVKNKKVKKLFPEEK